MDEYALLEDLNSDFQNLKALKGKVIKTGQCLPALIIVRSLACRKSLKIQVLLYTLK